jgi:serine/threonine-protein kinase
VIKVFDAAEDRVTTERELLAVSTINSPRVPRILENGVATTASGQCVWFCEQFIEGISLRDHLASKTLDIDELLQMARHLLQALSEAETAQIVHRDVKPDNIILGTDGELWLIDFGIARHLTLLSLTATANPFGKLTLGYAPPEQMRNNKSFIDSRADLFALGITLIESHIGFNPFWVPPPASSLEIMRRVESQPIKVDFGPSDKAKVLGGLVSAMTQRRRDLRPRNAADALDWLLTVEATD